MNKAQRIRGRKSEPRSKFCGNCYYHDAYEYPDLIICKLRYPNGTDFVVSTLECCENWEPDPQECFCVQEALEKRNRNSVEHHKE